MSVEFIPDVVAVSIGEFKPFGATVMDSLGNIVTNLPIIYWSSAPEIVKVDEIGMLDGISGGWAWISATCEGVTGWALVGVPTKGNFVVQAFPGDEVEFFGLNNVGQIVGESDFWDCILDQETGYRRIPEGAHDINDQGLVVVYAGIYDSNTGLYSKLPNDGWGSKINNLNQIVGTYWLEMTDPFGDPYWVDFLFKYDRETGLFEQLGRPSHNPLENPLLNIAINDKGQIVTGIYTGINNAGHKIGWDETSGYCMGFYEEDDYRISISLAPMTDDDENTYFYDINDFDQIIANADVTPTGMWSYLLTPCPFPWPFGKGVYPPFLPKRPLAPGVTTTIK
jgi:hypothetical protein